jgi:hypothetical protein
VGDSLFTGELAQLARAPALHAGGQGFDSLILHRFSSEFRVWSLELFKKTTRNSELKTRDCDNPPLRKAAADAEVL